MRLERLAEFLTASTGTPGTVSDREQTVPGKSCSSCSWAEAGLCLSAPFFFALSKSLPETMANTPRWAMTRPAVKWAFSAFSACPKRRQSTLANYGGRAPRRPVSRRPGPCVWSPWRRPCVELCSAARSPSFWRDGCAFRLLRSQLAWQVRYAAEIRSGLQLSAFVFSISLSPVFISQLLIPNPPSDSKDMHNSTDTCF